MPLVSYRVSVEAVLRWERSDRVLAGVAGDSPPNRFSRDHFGRMERPDLRGGVVRNAQDSERYGSSIRSGATKASGNVGRAASSTLLACVSVANGPSRTR